MEKISVIIPVLNEEALLPKILSCLKKQVGVSLEIIVADANSKDDSVKIAKSFGAIVVKGGLPAVGRNKGELKATNERLVFLDSDVEFENDFLIKCITMMKKKNIDVATVSSKPMTDLFAEKLVFKGWNLAVFLTQLFYPHAPGYCIFSTKNIHKKIRGFDERIRLGEDSNYVLKASKISKFRMLQIPIYVSTRRLKKEKIPVMVYKVVVCGVRRVFVGEDTGNYFKYNFGHQEVNKKKKK